jgi:hypothetical protein
LSFLEKQGCITLGLGLVPYFADVAYIYYF